MKQVLISCVRQCLRGGRPGLKGIGHLGCARHQVESMMKMTMVPPSPSDGGDNGRADERDRNITPLSAAASILAGDPYVPGSVLRTLRILTIPRKRHYRGPEYSVTEVQQLARSSKASKRQSWHLNPGSLALASTTTTCYFHHRTCHLAPAGMEIRVYSWRPRLTVPLSSLPYRVLGFLSPSRNRKG